MCYNLKIMSKQNHKKFLTNFIKGSLTVIISVLIIYGVVQAGTITPPSGTPVAQFYTLTDIFNRLDTNATATVGDHSFTFADALAGGGKTLTEIYNAIPTINPAKLLSDTTYLGVTGTIATQTLSAANDTVSAGYYDATTLSAVDTDLVAGNIKSGSTIFGVAGNVSAGYTYGSNDANYVLGTATAPGTALYHLYSGSIADYPQNTGGIEDYNNAGARPADAYAKTWTTCNVGNSYCGTNDATYAEAKDESTGLVWSTQFGVNTWFWANNCLYPNLLDADGVCDNTPVSEPACKCVKLDGINGAKTGCEAIGDGNWRLPYQKEIMQAYIDGSYNNPAILANTNFAHWTSTTTFSSAGSTASAVTVRFSNGNTSSAAKTTASSRVRCVR